MTACSDQWIGCVFVFAFLYVIIAQEMYATRSWSCNMFFVNTFESREVPYPRVILYD